MLNLYRMNGVLMFCERVLAEKETIKLGSWDCLLSSSSSVVCELLSDELYVEHEH